MPDLTDAELAEGLRLSEYEDDPGALMWLEDHGFALLREHVALRADLAAAKARCEEKVRKVTQTQVDRERALHETLREVYERHASHCAGMNRSITSLGRRLAFSKAEMRRLQDDQAQLLAAVRDAERDRIVAWLTPPGLVTCCEGHMQHCAEQIAANRHRDGGGT